MDKQRREGVKNYFANPAPNSLKVTPSTQLSMYVDGKLVGVAQNDVEPVPNPMHSVMLELDESKALHRLQKLYTNADVQKLPRHWDNVADPWVREAPILAQNRKRNVRSHHASAMLQLSMDQLRVTKTRAIAWKCFSCASVRANRPIPLALPFYYFEVSVVSKGQDCFIGVGLNQANVPLDRLPGWDIDSYGYHGDDGCFYASSVKGVKYGPTFTTGDVIGCGVNFETRKLFFTKNGQHLGFVMAQPLTLGSVPLYPTVGMQSSGEMSSEYHPEWGKFLH